MQYFSLGAAWKGCVESQRCPAWAGRRLRGPASDEAWVLASRRWCGRECGGHEVQQLVRRREEEMERRQNSCPTWATG